jgi:DNA-binding transcriptional regulator/RsmH inhibitor MraZ
MSGDFLGVFENAVHNNRITLPAVFKKSFSASSKQTVIVTMGSEGTNLAVYPLDNWNAIIDKLKHGDERDKMFMNSLIEFALSKRELEGPGRIRIDSFLLDDVGIEDSVIIKGEGDYISLWNPEKFREERKKKLQYHSDNFKAINYRI